MFNSKKNYVSPEVNVILVGEDIITVSPGELEPLETEGVETPPIPMD